MRAPMVEEGMSDASGRNDPMVMTSIGIVGLGAMGLPIARTLLARGFAVRGHARKQAARSALRDAGGDSLASAREAATGVGLLLLVVVDAAQAEQVLFADGALEALPRGGIVMLSATCPPKAVETIAVRVLASGRRFLDAPLSGGTAGAEAGTLTIMAAAAEETLAMARPVLEALGSKVYIVGERPGQGAAIKIINQLLCGVHLAAAAEALALADQAGVDGDTLLDILGGSAASSWMLRDRGPRMLQDEPVVSSAVDIFVKDLGLVLDAGRAQKVALPLAAAAHQLFLAASGRGHGQADDSQVLGSYRALNGARRSRTASATASAVMPKCANSSPGSPDAPKPSMPTKPPSSPT